jgi:hypothetical protein
MSEHLTNGLEDLPPRRLIRPPVNLNVWRAIAAVGLVLAAASMLLTVILFTTLEREGRERRQQNCQTFEQDHYAEVASLAGTYRFLTSKPRALWDDTRRFVARVSMPQLERDARRDDDRAGVNVPEYCDEDGYGLAEPDPCVPGRPAGLGLPETPGTQDRPCKVIRFADR